MPPAHHPAVVLRDLTFQWPDGSSALTGVRGAFARGRTGLIGRNGSGKSTLLRLIAGRLHPTRGSVEASGTVGYLPQNVTIDATTTLADLLGIAPVLTALSAIEAGETDPKLFTTIGDDWDIQARATAALNRIGVAADDLRRAVTTLSGGEAMLVAITGLALRRTDITLLDEPTNNLDAAARHTLYELINSWHGTLIVVSHDEDLLNQLDATAEIHDGALAVFGGPYDAWRAHLKTEQEAAQQAARTAQRALDVHKRQRVDAEATVARRARAGRRNAGSLPPILAGARKRQAQESAGSLRATLDARVAAAQRAVDTADARVRDEDCISLDLPDPELSQGRRIAEFSGLSGQASGRIVLQGPQRVALVGPNGSGKSTLLAQLASGSTGEPGRVAGQLHTERCGYLPQRLDTLDPLASALDNVHAVAPDQSSGDIRNHLARLLIRGSAADRPVGSLSGGEQLRVAMARLLYAKPSNQLLILDEPTNNLDITSRDHLIDMLSAYKGALIVVSHDERFLAGIGLDTVLELDATGTLSSRTTSGPD